MDWEEEPHGLEYILMDYSTARERGKKRKNARRIANDRAFVNVDISKF